MFPELTELHLIGCSIELIWIPRSKSNTLTPKTQLTDILTKGNFTRDEWNHLLNLFNISHFSSTACTAAMAKRAQQESGEERFTAKSRPMMNLTARMPSIVSSLTSSNPGKTWYGHQDLGKSVVADERSGKPDRLSPTGSSKMDYGRSWSSQEWKSEAAAHDRSGKPEEISWESLQKVDPHREEPLLGRLGRSRNTNLVILSRLSAMVAYDGFGVWWKVWRHWERCWTIGDVLKPVCGTGSPKQTSSFTRRRLCSAIPNCQ